MQVGAAWLMVIEPIYLRDHFYRIVVYSLEYFEIVIPLCCSTHFVPYDFNYFEVNYSSIRSRLSSNPLRVKRIEFLRVRFKLELNCGKIEVGWSRGSIRTGDRLKRETFRMENVSIDASLQVRGIIVGFGFHFAAFAAPVLIIGLSAIDICREL